MNEGEFLYVKNWWKFQGYRKSGPRWIKLHRALLSDPEFDSLTEIQQWRLVRLWLYASEIDGRLPGDSTKIGRRLGLYHSKSCHDFISILIDKGFLSNKDIRGNRHKNSATETEGETEAYTETENNPPTPLKKGVIESLKKTASSKKEFTIPSWIDLKAWTSYVEMRQRIRKPMTCRAMELAISKLEELRGSGQDPGKVLDQSVLNSWQGLFPIRKNIDMRKNEQAIDPNVLRKMEEFDRLHSRDRQGQGAVLGQRGG